MYMFMYTCISISLFKKKWFPLSTEMLEIANDSREEMLQIANNCYTKARECESDESEEEWLQHYMIGKCLEKMKKPPQEFLQCYKVVSDTILQTF